MRASGSGPHLTRARSAPRILGDRYQLERRIGAGGMAEVYLATDLILERDVAVKVLYSRWASDDAQVDRFRREALALATLESPRIVPVYDLRLGPDEHYLVMRHVVGRTFEQLIDESGPLPPSRATRIVSDVLEGLTALHARRLVHRDIKPANVLIDVEDRAILVDLGVASDRRKRSLTPAHVTLGTPDFMAPEQRTTGAVDHRSDLYQTGNLLLHALTGRDPTTLPAPSRIALVATLPPRLAQVVARALADEPDARFPSADAMRAALDRATDTLAVATSDIEPAIELRRAPSGPSRMRRLTRPATPPPTIDPPATPRPPTEPLVARRPPTEPLVARRPPTEPSVFVRPMTQPPAVQRAAIELPATSVPLPATCVPSRARPVPRRAWRWMLATAAAIVGFAIAAMIAVGSSRRRTDEVEPWTPPSVGLAVRAEVARRWRKPRAPEPEAAEPWPAATLPLRADPAEYLFLADLYETSGRHDTAIEALRLFKQVAPATEHAAIDQRIARLRRR